MRRANMEIMGDLGMSELKRKVLRTIAGCSTEKQLSAAINYANLAMKRAKSWERTEWLVVFEKYVAVVQFKLGVADRSLYVVEC